MKYFKAAIKILAIFAVIICVADVAVLILFSRWQPEPEHSGSVIILGAAINTPALYNRTLTGLNLYEQNLADVMVFSGGRIADSDISEAQYMEKVVMENADRKINYILEEDSHNTYDNIKNSKAKLGDNTDSVIIVSDEFHLARAVLLAKRAGFEKVYWAAPKPTYYDESKLRFYYFREFLAILNYLPKFIFG